MEQFIKDIIVENYGEEKAQSVYDKSPLIRYLDKKTGAIHGDSKTRRSLANIYAIYSILYYYVDEFYQDKEKYKQFLGYDYTKLFVFYRKLYGGSKLQNHALNSRVNGEFRNKIVGADKDLIIINDGKYALHIDFLYVDNIDISKVCKTIIEKYISLLIEKDNGLVAVLEELRSINNCDDKKVKILSLLTEDSEARIFEIISYAILKSHYSSIEVFFGYTKETIEKAQLQLFKTGRTNANDGGIDFVMRPVGRFFQVTEVNNYDKYLLDIDKVLHFPVTFVIKTLKSKENVLSEIGEYINNRSGGMVIIKERYQKAIEEVITINELKEWLMLLGEESIDKIIKDIDIYYRIEMNLIADDET